MSIVRNRTRFSVIKEKNVQNNLKLYKIAAAVCVGVDQCSVRYRGGQQYIGSGAQRSLVDVGGGVPYRRSRHPQR